MTYNQAEALLDGAFEAYNKGDFYTAEEQARAARRLVPHLADSWYLLGVLAFRANALESSCDTLYQAVQLDKKNHTYQLMLASVLHKLGRLDEALTYYKKHADNPDALAQTGYIYIQQKKEKEAESVFKKCLEKSPQHAEALIGLAVLKRKNKNDKEALKILLKAPLTANVAYQLSLQYAAQQQFHKAFEAIQKAMGISETPAFLTQAGMCAVALHQQEMAETFYKKALKEDPFFAPAHVQLGHLYLQQKSPLSAIEEYKRAINENRDCIEAYHALGVALYQENQKEMALEYYRKALRICPTYVPTLYNLANVLKEQAVFDEAAGLYVHLLLLPDSPDVSVELAACLLQMQDKKTALRFAKGWVKHFADSQMARHVLCLLQGKKSEFEKEFSEKLFDAFAPEYDQKMKHLETQVVQEMIPFIKGDKTKSLLDLGCGTGAVGKEVKGQFLTVTGVDVSAEMIRLARRTKAYDTLIKEDILTFLKKSSGTYDVIVAADVFCYMQDLKEVFAAVFDCLKGQGSFVFSVETGKKNTTVGGRFLFPAAEIKRLLTQCGFQIKQVKSCSLRKEETSFAKGIIIYAIKG